MAVLLLSLGMGALLDVVEEEPDQTEVAFIPTAGDPYDDASFVEADREKLIKHGFAVTVVDLKGQTHEDLEAKLAGKDVVYVAGGNTFYLLEQVRASGFDRILPRLLAEGTLYVGASAGAAILGPSIAPYAKFDDPGAAPSLSSQEGLQIVNYVVIPHYSNEKFRPTFDEVMKAEDGRFEFRTLGDDEALFMSGDGTTKVIASP